VQQGQHQKVQHLWNLKCKTTTEVVQQSSITKCEACNDGIKLLNDLINSSLLKGSLIKLLQAECLKLGAPWATGCVDTVAVAIDDVVKFITDMTDRICPDLVKCASASFVVGEASESRTCNGLQGIYNSVPTFVATLSSVCSVFHNPTQAAGCVALFTKDIAGPVSFAQKTLVWTAAHLPVLPECHLIGANGKPDVLDAVPQPSA